MSLAKRNLIKNRSLEAGLCCEGMLNGQEIGALSGMRFGLFTLGYCGCGCIAVYNALNYLGKAPAFSELIFFMERSRMLFGLLGTNPFSLGKALKHYGADCIRSDFAGEARAFIVSFWTRKPFLSAIHTVFCVRDEQGITVYNRYNQSSEARWYSSLKELTDGRRPVALYELAEVESE